MKQYVNFKAQTHQLGMIYGKGSAADHQTYPITNPASVAREGEKYLVGMLLPDWVDLGKIPSPTVSYGTSSHAVIAHDGGHYLVLGFGGNSAPYSLQELENSLKLFGRELTYDWAIAKIEASKQLFGK